MNYLYFLVIFFVIKYSTQLKPTEVIKTDKGPIRGKILQTVAKNIPFSSFEGVPYGKPPIGPLRFQPPEEVDEWKDVRNTTREASVCPQWNYEDSFFDGHEDCLYLNVYTPKVSIINSTDNKLRAVMVWIYGGAFVTGYVNRTRYGPDLLIEDDIVIVAMNYRLGALGFLALNISDATGNAGLKDQTLALQWVKRNIDKFGGDPNRVTIFGQSAGSASVGFHVLSPLSKGLFHGAIYMSGTPLNFWAFYRPDEAISRSFYLGEILGIITDNKTALLEKLKSVTAEQIIEATKNMTLLDLPFNPTIESPSVSKTPFLNECSTKKYESGDFNHVPQIIGFVNVETLSFASDVTIFLQSVNQTINQFIHLPGVNTILNLDILKNIVSTGLSDLGTLTVDVIDVVTDLTTDIAFKDGIDRTQKYLIKNSKQPIYYYKNSFDYPQAIHKVEGNFLNGTAHSDDIAHVFWVSHRNQSLNPQSSISKQRSKMVKLWSNFAKYGNPTPNATDPILEDLNWPASDSDGTCLEIDKDYSIGKRPIKPVMKLVQKLLNTLRPADNGC
ncbi:GSCOCT00002551001.2-RA-CDS [Cotesia congregata]|uniref:Carboxylic ester hydrolase n=1 Tax=Cotesia congregata TaxID=51543 RepID=A0A8J2H7A2_COTCN|nr:GSCOCT00002551001.2-RA-CDS [Cotesia congregata]CAG5081477.1 carboxylesterase clade B member 5 [Cotesia congregata]